jgi:peroxiredoxin
MKHIRLFLFISCSFIFIASVFSQENFQVRFKLPGVHDTTVMIANYYGNGTYVKDTIKADREGNCIYEAKSDLPRGIYILVINEKKYFEFIMDKDRKFSMEPQSNDFIKSMKITGSPDNSLFYNYLRYNREKYAGMERYDKLLAKVKPKSDSAVMLSKKIDSVNTIIINYKLKLVQDHPQSFIAFLINAMKEPEIPETIPLLPDGKKDSTFAYRYYKSHFWDGTDFTDDRLLRTPVFYTKLVKYYDKVIFQNPDSIIKSADAMIAMTKPNPEMFKYVVWFCTYHYENSEVMGLDKVFVHMINTYYHDGQTPWVTEAVKENLIKKANRLGKLLIGQKAPNMIMVDTANQLVSMQDIKAKFLFLLFWDPDCGHCEVEIPKIKDFYNQNKNQYDIKILAVCSDTSLVKWKNSIKKKGIEEWINVDGPRTLTGDYHDLYDITTTPVVYILNSRKEIIAKRLGSDQFGTFLKNYVTYHPAP